MSFYDIPEYKSYEDFEKHMKKIAPYKKSNSWPLGARAYSARHFVLREDDRGRHLDLFYMNRGIREGIESGAPEYAHQKERMERCRLARVSSDNTVTFNAQVNSGSAAPLLSRVFGVHICQDSRRGGAVLRTLDSNNALYPLFKGATFELGSFKLKQHIKIVQRRVNRKKVDEAMKATLDFQKTYPGLLRSMTLNGMQEVAEDLKEQYPVLDLNSRHRSTVMKIVAELIEKKFYVDAAIAYGYWSDWRFRAMIHGHGGAHGVAAPEAIVKNLELCLSGSNFRRAVTMGYDAFDHSVIPVGEFPQSRWETEVYHYGNLVERL